MFNVLDGLCWDLRLFLFGFYFGVVIVAFSLIGC